ncbi:MAG TPA: hypothetical protein VIM00_11415 [Candidatus Acidoferrum sp.]|jgi:hypothetical protein
MLLRLKVSFTVRERIKVCYATEANKRRFHVRDSVVLVVRQESLIEEPESA